MKNVIVYRADKKEGLNISKFQPNKKNNDKRLYVTFSETEAVAWGIMTNQEVVYQLEVNSFFSSSGENIIPPAYIGIEDIPMREGWVYEENIHSIRKI